MRPFELLATGCIMFRLLTTFALFLLLLTQYRLWWGENGLLEYWQLRQQVAQQQQQNQQLTKRNQRLDAQVQDLKNARSAIEERARFDLGMIGKHETFYWLIGEPPRQFFLPETEEAASAD